MPVRNRDYMDYGLWYHNAETGEDHPVEETAGVTTTTTAGYVRNHEIPEEYRGIPVNERGICQNEQCLPEDAVLGDVWRIQDSRDRWVWTGSQWEQLDIWYAEPDVAVQADNDTAPVLVQGDYLYIPGDYANRATATYVVDNPFTGAPGETITGTLQNPFEEMPYGWGEYRTPETTRTVTAEGLHGTTEIPDERFREVLERIREGAAFNLDNLAELRNVEGARHSFVTDDDNTSDTPQEAFEEIFEVGA